MAKIIGINDEQTVCDCCGKKNLKRTVIIDIDGNIVRYGTTCASRIFHKHEQTIKEIGTGMEMVKGLVNHLRLKS